MKLNELVLNYQGYYTVKNPPSVAELKQYYQNKYWQEITGINAEMTDVERNYIANTVKLKGYVVHKFLKSFKNTLLDIGCGEGHTLNFFSKNNWQVTGLDFSNFGVKRHYPDLLPDVIIGDIYESLDKLIENKEKFSLVVLDNVLEHVLSPSNLLKKIRLLLEEENVDSGILVRVPNDFSVLQSFLTTEKIVNKQYWVTQPDHLNYFNVKSLAGFFSKNGFKEDIIYSDWPIELDLLNPNTNYVENKLLGKNSHIARMMTENIIAQNIMSDVLNYYEASARIGLGRTITGFFSINTSVKQ